MTMENKNEKMTDASVESDLNMTSIERKLGWNNNRKSEKFSKRP